MDIIVGREEEREIMDRLLKSKSAELVAVYGRRRIGKTYLVQTYLNSNIVFSQTGMYKARVSAQLQQFSLSLQRSLGSAITPKSPANWIEAFEMLRNYLSAYNNTKKQVIFFDEFPWLEGRKSGFHSAFEHFWNTWAVNQPKLVVIICGSAASWMINYITDSKGAMFHRVTQKIPLGPFNLGEAEAFLKRQGSKLDRYQILQLYMALGGIPEYLKHVGKDQSASQAIQRVCFSKQGLLAGEFENLYNSLFEKAENHIKIVRTLAKNGKGLTRQEIIDRCELSSGGRATTVLLELEKSGFIRQIKSYDKKAKDAIYHIADEFSIFYLKYMENNPPGSKDTWAYLSKQSSYASWSGIAFESLCLKHIEQVKSALKIKGRAVETSWRYVPTLKSKEKGAQIDLLIDRDDRIINICEIKFYNGPFQIDKTYAKSLEQKMDIFNQKQKPAKTLFLTFITSFGLAENSYSDQLVQQQLTMDALFKII